MNIQIIKDSVSKSALSEIAKSQFGNLVKAVVDVEKGIIAIGGELHTDEEAALLDDGSRQEHLWGINLYPEEEGEGFIEFDSMINVRPSSGNRSRGVESEDIQVKIKMIVSKLIL